MPIELCSSLLCFVDGKSRTISPSRICKLHLPTHSLHTKINSGNKASGYPFGFGDSCPIPHQNVFGCKLSETAQSHDQVSFSRINRNRMSEARQPTSCEFFAQRARRCSDRRSPTTSYTTATRAARFEEP